MRYIIVLLITMFGFLGQVEAQTAVKGGTKTEKKANVTVDNNGNFVAVSRSATTAPGADTGKTYTDNKGKVYPVLKSKNGKHYVVKVSAKTGNEYKYYLKLPNE